MTRQQRYNVLVYLLDKNDEALALLQSKLDDL
jgi:hypothetical protein